ncbi:DUF4880 domain-containing protein [Bowmanella sp. JS7-9]|uniref:FecR/PupR family sigma factor regulator n=1 Tax=Pseudobowmanella zhangzhouensis TaxID=1537679 RepID=A0ABW1XMW0_9ALTE|nr:DUF4880 domain-containing protein [Bowmanella sp. JS7-9]TBX23773.1 hypothetical protein TK45_06710 [Bowmanella sp. JS7-9]
MMSIEEWTGYGLPEEITDAAIAWLVKLESGEMDEAQHQQFKSWLDAQPEHRWAFEDVSTVWAKSSVVRTSLSPIAIQTAHKPAAAPARISRADLYTLITLAAVFAGVLLGSALQ